MYVYHSDLSRYVPNCTVFNATFNNISAISWRSVLLVEDIKGPGENHWHATSHWQSLSHNVEPTSVVIGTDCISSCKSNYQTATMAPKEHVKKNYTKGETAR
jgi:hypothetical protein